MKYIVVDKRIDSTGDIFTAEFDIWEAALTEMNLEWENLEMKEREERRIYVLESSNPDDEEAEDHMDGLIIAERSYVKDRIREWEIKYGR